MKNVTCEQLFTCSYIKVNDFNGTSPKYVWHYSEFFDSFTDAEAQRCCSFSWHPTVSTTITCTHVYGVGTM